MTKYFSTDSIIMFVAFITISVSSQTWAATVVTTDPTVVATFQAGASVLGFDAIPPNGGGGSFGNTGKPIQPESQLTDQFSNVGVIFSSTGGAVGVVGVEGLPNESDATSPFNLIGDRRRELRYRYSITFSPLPFSSFYPTPQRLH